MQQQTTPVALKDSEVQELVSQMRGELLRSSDAGYEQALRVYNGMIEKRPALIAHCVDVADVIAAVNFAREHQLTLAVRGGGHSGPGLGTCDGGLVIDLSGMKGIRVDPSTICSALTWSSPMAALSQSAPGIMQTCSGPYAAVAVTLASPRRSYLNEVVLNQVLVMFGDANRTQRIIAAIQQDGTCWCGGTIWQRRTAMRISVSSWATTDVDVERSLETMIRVARERE